MSNTIVRKLAVPLGASPEAAILHPELAKTIVSTFYNVLFDDCPDYFLAISHSPGHTRIRTFASSVFDMDEESTLLDILITIGLTEQHLYNILGILGPDTEGTIHTADKTITILESDGVEASSLVYNYETLERINI